MKHPETNNRKAANTLQRCCALLMATVFCVSAIAGCGGGKKKEPEKTQTQQSQQTVEVQPSPEIKNESKKDTAEKDTAKKDTAKKDAAGEKASQTAAAPANKTAPDTAKKSDSAKPGTKS